MGCSCSPAPLQEGLYRSTSCSLALAIESSKGSQFITNSNTLPPVGRNRANCRASGSDEALKLVPPTTLSLEQSMEFLADDELLEVTPKSIRLRKMILDKSLRLKAESRRK